MVYLPPTSKLQKKPSSARDKFSGGTEAPLPMRLRRWISLAPEPGRVESIESLSQYRYGMYGEVTQTVGTLASDFQYAGYYFHAPSGLNLTVYRAYNSSLGRWINRDPINDLTFGMMPSAPEPKVPGAMMMAAAPDISQTNPYAYVSNAPIGYTDPAGLGPCKNPWPWPGPVFKSDAQCALECMHECRKFRGDDVVRTACFFTCFIACRFTPGEPGKPPSASNNCPCK